MSLLPLLESELGPSEYHDGRHWFVCPFHPDDNPSLCILPKNGPKERFHCFGCGESGDGIDFVRKLYPKLTFVQARRKAFSFLRGCQNLVKSRCKDAKTQDANHPGPKTAFASSPDPCWQSEYEIILRCWQKRLWRTSETLDYLQTERGLKDHTIKAAKLGFPQVEIGFAISIPWFDRGQLRAINIRRLESLPKYKAVKGSRKGFLYPDVRLNPAKPVLICEGEFDTLLANQEAGSFLQAVTLGSASDSPPVRVLAELVLCPTIFFAFDGDKAGQKATTRLASLLPHGRALKVPPGMDLTDVHHESGLKRFLSKRIKTNNQHPQTKGTSC